MCDVSEPSNMCILLAILQVVMLGNTSESLEIGDLPIVSGDMRATYIFDKMKHATRTIKLKFGSWRATPGSGWELIWRLLRVNALLFTIEMVLAAVCAVLFYTPAVFLKKLVEYLESDPERNDRGWGFFFCIGLFLSNAIMQLREYFCPASSCISRRLV